MQIIKLAVATLVLLTTAAPAYGQYGTRGRAREPAFYIGVAPAVLLGHTEMVRSSRPADPLAPSRMSEDRPLAPGLGLSLRWGRSFQFYIAGSRYLGGDLDVSGSDPLSGAPVDSTASVAATHTASGGLSFVPIEPLRLELGLGKVWLGDGGDYLAFRGAAFVDLWDWSEQFVMSAGAEIWAAGGVAREDELERQLKEGWLAAFKLRFDWIIH